MFVVQRLDQGFQARFHLLIGSFRWPTVETDRVNQGQGLRQGRMKYAEALCDSATNVVGDDVCTLQPPVGHQTLQDWHLPGNGCVDSLIKGALRRTKSQQVEHVNFVPSLSQLGGDVAPDVG